MFRKKFFHKIGIGFARWGEHSLPHISDAKRYGNQGEDDFVCHLKAYLPDCQIKRNIVVHILDGNAEIDCLVLYDDKLFAIEIKNWKGELAERDGQFVQYKLDRWTDEWHVKNHKSPFRQLARAIYLLRKQIPEKAWINSVVYFDSADKISVSDENSWFNDIYSLTEYIKNKGQTSFRGDPQAFFNQCVPADYLYSGAWDKSLHCLIYDDSLTFRTSSKVIHKSDISTISIKHHWSYDELYIKTHQGITYTVKCENKRIRVVENGKTDEYALCKLDYIELGCVK
jgi:hypothetical protein